MSHSNMSTSNNAFINAVQHTVGNRAREVIDEKGLPRRSMYGLSDIDPVKGFCAMFAGITDDTDESDCRQHIRACVHEIDRATHKSEAERAQLYAMLITGIMQVRDIRNNGKGRRDQTYAMFDEMSKKFPKTMLSLIEELKEHGGWMDLNKLYLREHEKTGNTRNLTKLQKCIISLWIHQLRVDTESLYKWKQAKASALHNGATFDMKCEVSLAAKWVPKEGRSVDKKTKCAKKIAQALYPEKFATNFKEAMRLYRGLLAPLQDAINTTEKLMCSKQFDKINFRFVPGKCMFKGRKAFLYEKKRGTELRGVDPKRLKCRANLQKHMQAAIEGKTKLHGKTMYLHELATKVYEGGLSSDEELLIHAQYLSHKRHFEELMKSDGCKIGNGVVCADFSGSMQGTPMAGAMAVGILASDLAEGPWKNIVFTFDTTPQILKLSYPESKLEFDAFMESEGSRNGYDNKHPLGSWDSSRAGGELTFPEKVRLCYNSPWGGSTDFLKLHDLIIDIGLTNNLTPEQMPEWFITASDMQFNTANRPSQTTRYKNFNYIGSQNNSSYRYSSYTSNSNPWKDHHKILVDAYNSAGFNMPDMIYWNMRTTQSYVTDVDTPGVQMLGGMSTMQLKIVLEDMKFDVPEKPKKTPWDTFCTAVEHGCYHGTWTVIETVGEGIFQYYMAPMSDDEVANAVSTPLPEPVKDVAESKTQNVSSTPPKTPSTVSTMSQVYEATQRGWSTSSDDVRERDDDEGWETDPESLPQKVATKTPMEKLKEAKQLLDAGLINQTDYDKLKVTILAELTR